MNATIRTLLVLFLACGAVHGQRQRLAKGPQWMEIVLERNESGTWRSIDSGLVLDRDDLIRFRFKTNFSGYLYVINSGTSGTRSLLFPTGDSGTENRIAAGIEYAVPATQETAFRVAGPPGHDVVYWLVSPVRLSGDPARAMLRQEDASPPARLMPRCNDSIFRSRGLCVDSSAGPRSLPEGESLPDAVTSLPNMRTRDLVILKDKQGTRISTPEALTGPVIYEFRLAHR